MRFIGDVHGKFDSYKKLIKNVPESIQVGDMGVGFKAIHGEEIINLGNPPHDAMSRGDHRFIRGNHDNPAVCKKQEFYIPDGDMCNGVFCLGGAKSIDIAYRTEGLDYWPDEELSYSELTLLIDRYAILKPKYVCTHDCPDSVANEIMMAYNRTKIEEGSRTRQALEIMFDLHKPEYWIFGHWHVGIQFHRSGTNFVCLAELEAYDLEIKS